MARQEVIDGPGVAAKILSRIPAEEREHLVAAIRAEAPKVASTLARRLTNLSAQERTPSSSTVVKSEPLIGSSALPQSTPYSPSQPAAYRASPESKTQRIETIIEPSSPIPDIETAQSRILRRLEELYPEASTAPEQKPSKSRLA